METLERYEQTRKKIYNTKLAISKELARYHKRTEVADLIFRDGVITVDILSDIKKEYRKRTAPLEEYQRVVEKYSAYVDYKMGQDYPEYASPFDTFFEPEKLTESEYETLKNALVFESEIFLEEVTDGERK